MCLFEFAAYFFGAVVFGAEVGLDHCFRRCVRYCVTKFDCGVFGCVAFFECAMPEFLEFVFIVFGEALGMDDEQVVVVFMGVVDGGVQGTGGYDFVVYDAEFVVHQSGAVGFGVGGVELMEVVVVGDDLYFNSWILGNAAQGGVYRGEVDFVEGAVDA